MTLKGSQSWAGTPSGCKSWINGFRGSALRFDPRLLSDNPSGCFQPKMSKLLGQQMKSGFQPSHYPWGDPRVTSGNGAEFVAVDRDGNMYGGEPSPKRLQKYVRVRP